MRQVEKETWFSLHTVYSHHSVVWSSVFCNNGMCNIRTPKTYLIKAHLACGVWINAEAEGGTLCVLTLLKREAASCLLLECSWWEESLCSWGYYNCMALYCFLKIILILFYTNRYVRVESMVPYMTMCWIFFNFAFFHMW